MEMSPENSTVERIIAAAIPLFANKGFASVSVKELAEAAGVNIALISYHFGGKEKLYLFILKQHIDVMKKSLQRLEASKADPVEKIRLFIKEAVQLHKKSPYFGQLVHSEKLNPTVGACEIFKEGGVTLHTFLRKCIQEAIEMGKFRSTIHADYATLAVSGMLHMFFAWEHHRDFLPLFEHEPECYVEEMFDIFLQGVVKSSSL
ncbi:MAG: TetR family transcriptional regulator [Pelosinus sp.]|nr:TetR family transcriptional regulator [Pelosinus sp.]